MNNEVPRVLTLERESSPHLKCDNHVIATVNDHVVRLATMTEPYPWHFHPNSDETFLVIEGGLCIEFENGGFTLALGQLATVSAGVVHRTRPVGLRSVNVTFEASELRTVLV